MALYVYPDDQNVAFGDPLLLQDSIPCMRHYVLHENGTGILTTRGVVNNPCALFTRYKVTFKSNIAIPTGGTLGEISLSVTVNGEPIPYSLSAATPTANEAFFSVSGFAYVNVLKGSNPSVAIRNTSATAGTITARNTEVGVDRVA